jgi:2'-5' RNA ligase
MAEIEERSRKPAGGASRRLFVALLPTEPVKAALDALATGPSAVRWTAPNDLHLTLRFIGEVPSETERRIEEALETVSVARFFLDVGGVGQFPPRGRPSVLYAGIGRGHPLLHQLRQQVDDRLLSLGLSLELGSFLPHLTLGRCRAAPPVSVQHWLKRHREFEGPVWPVGTFHLLCSGISPGKGKYRTLSTYPLG